MTAPGPGARVGNMCARLISVDVQPNVAKVAKCGPKACGRCQTGLVSLAWQLGKGPEAIVDTCFRAVRSVAACRRADAGKLSCGAFNEAAAAAARHK